MATLPQRATVGEAFRPLLGLSRRLASADDPATLYEAVVESAVELSGAARVELWVREPDGRVLQVHGWPDPGVVRPTTAAAPDGRGPGQSSGHFDQTTQVRLTFGDSDVGYLVVHGGVPTGEAIEVLATYAAAALACLQARRTLQRTLLQTVTALAALVETKDEYTEDHCMRIAELALQVGIRLGLSPKRLDQLTYAAILHDIGKIGVPDAVLGKRGPLTEAEWAQMRRHPTIGREVLSGVEFLRDAAIIVEQHHERFDGTGYPRGLAGEAITLEARIIAVVDAYDAMVSTRPYRRAMSREEALAELRRCAGTQFDPAVVEALISVVGQGG